MASLVMDVQLPDSYLLTMIKVALHILMKYGFLYVGNYKYGFLYG